MGFILAFKGLIHFIQKACQIVCITQCCSLLAGAFFFLTPTPDIPILFTVIPQHILISPIHCNGYMTLFKTHTSNSVELHSQTAIRHWQRRGTLDFLILLAGVKAWFPVKSHSLYCCFRWSLSCLFTATSSTCSCLVIHAGMTIRCVLMELPVIVACISGVKCLINACKKSLSYYSCFIDHPAFRLASDGNSIGIVLLFRIMYGGNLIPSANITNVTGIHVFSQPSALITDFTMSVQRYKWMMCWQHFLLG